MATNRPLTADDRAEVIEELEEIATTIREALANAKDTMRRVGGMHLKRAQAYWLTQIEHILDGGSMCSLQDTIDDIRNGDDD